MLEKAVNITKVIYYGLGCLVAIVSIVFSGCILWKIDKESKENE
jgi:hypothetical protein